MEHSISSDFIRGHIDTIILHSIIDNDKFAQQISDTIEQKSQNKYQINQATLYSSLKRLESLGYVKSYWNDAPDGRRKYIKITDSGKQYLQENISVWAYSRGIIDKLIDVQPEQVVKYVEIEKIVEKPVEKIIEKPVLSPILQQTENIDTKIDEIKPVTAENQSTEKIDTNLNDIAFRSILAELIKSNDAVEKNKTQLEDNEIIELNLTEKQEKIKLEDTIDDTKYIPQKTGDFNKIDFSDIVENAKNDDLKVKVSSKNPSIKVGSVYVNLLNFVASILIFGLTLTEFIYISANYSQILGFTTVITVASICILSIFPIISLFRYVKKPKKTAQKIHGDSILVSFIVAFNVILIAFALNLLLNINFNATETIIYTLAIPTILAIDSIVYYILRFLLSKIKAFKYTIS